MLAEHGIMADVDREALASQVWSEVIMVVNERLDKQSSQRIGIVVCGRLAERLCANLRSSRILPMWLVGGPGALLWRVRCAGQRTPTPR